MPEAGRPALDFAGKLRVTLAALAAMLVFAGPAAACLVCIALPERTLADRVIEADAVVLAREDPARPFAYAPAAVLKGAAEGRPIPVLVDSTTRKRLAADPAAEFVVARYLEAAREAPGPADPPADWSLE